MRKQDKKRDNAIRAALTRVCETLLESQPGFLWLTHKADYQCFPQSLTIVLVFENDMQSEQCQAASENDIGRLIADQLAEVGITLPRANRHLRYDSESACETQHNGNWARRLSVH